MGKASRSYVQNMRMMGNIGTSANLPMTAWAHHFLLEGVPTCHSGSWILLSRWMLRVLSLLANRRRESQDPKVEIDSRSVGRITGRLRGCSESIFRLGDLHMEPPAAQSPCFVYLQANNDMYTWNQVICTQVTMFLLVSSQKECFVDG